MSIKPVVLCILDGWGYREDSVDNAIKLADTPNYDRMWRDGSRAWLATSGPKVGLPDGQMGNSEVGHTNLGSGRVVLQDLPRIDKAFAEDSVKDIPAFTDFTAKLKTTGGTAHIMGLLSPGGVHSHQDHMVGLAKAISAAGIPVRFHLFLDGRDTAPNSALEFVGKFESDIAAYPDCEIATATGRYWAMDRDNRWDRVSRAYNTMSAANSTAQADNAGAAIEAAYNQDKTDEFVDDTVIGNYTGMNDGDGLICANFRADRAREILSAFVDPAFAGFERKKTVTFGAVLGMVEYSSALNEFLPALFPSFEIKNSLGEILSNSGIKQLRIAETEKYAHVTFFFNGGKEDVFDGEDRILIPSPDVATYDLQPEMSAPELTDKLVEAIDSGIYGCIIVNYANPDMVGHTGILSAAQKAVEAVDTCIGRVRGAVTRAGGTLLVTADHGNVELMRNQDTGVAHTAHTSFDVPIVMIGADDKVITDGCLADVSPSILGLLGLDQPTEMTGKNLIMDKE